MIVPCYHCRATLGRLLAALAVQTWQDFELILVDDGNPSPVSLNPDDYPFPLTLVRQNNQGLAAARNAGAALARGKVLWFLDADVVPGPAALAAHLSAQRPDRATVTVGALPFPDGLPPSAFRWYLERWGQYDLYARPGKYRAGRPPIHPVNGNAALPRATFEQHGPFDPAFRAYGSEDLDLGWRLEKAGVAFVYVPEAIGHHYHLKNYPAHLRDQFSAGRALALLTRKHPEIAARKDVNVVTTSLLRLPPRKATRRALWLTLRAAPFAVRALERILTRWQHRYALRRPLYPLFRLTASYQYAQGLDVGLAETSPPP